MTLTVYTGAAYLLYLPFFALIVVYLPALYELVSTWSQDANYSHGFLVPVISAWLLWKKMDRLRASAEQDTRGLIVLRLDSTLCP